MEDIIKIQSISEYPLDDAAHAHEVLESRQMIGSPVLRP